MKKIALELFGQYRSYKLNFKYNMTQLLSQLENYSIDIYIFSENYNAEYEKDILNIIESFKPKHDITLKMIKYYEYIDQKYKNESKVKQLEFNNNVDEIYGKNIRLHHSHGYNNFTIEYIYRKYLLHLLSKNLFTYNYEFIINARLFDVSLNIMKPFDFLDKIDDTIYHSIDTFYIAKESVMTKFLLKCVEYKIKDINKPEFRKVLKSYDYNLNGCFPFLSSELITLSTLHDNFKNINIRYNFTAVEISNEPKNNWINYLDIRLCKHRHQNILGNEKVNINGLKIAKYGSNNTFIDVTNIIKKYINKKVIIGNNLFNFDPLVGVKKQLHLEFNNKKIILDENVNLEILY
jgi:hypothetical protein